MVTGVIAARLRGMFPPDAPSSFHFRPAMRRLAFLSCCAMLALALASSGMRAQAGRPDTTDNFRWLEEITGARAMAWVKAENAKTAAVLEKDPRYAGIYNSALAMAQARDRLAYVRFLHGALYNFWQDSAHVRGIWRRTTLASYRTASPEWTTVLDLDSLATAEKANWVWQGSACARPDERRCLLFLSDGGEDANTVREFDVTSLTLVKDGFFISKGKQRVSWSGVDTLLVSREWKAGEVTSSGYPYIVKRQARGQKLADAVEIFRGSAKDGGYGVSPLTLTDAKGHRVSFIDRPLSTFGAEKYLVRPKDVAKFSIPLKGWIVELIDGQVVVQLSDDWKSDKATIRAGSLAAFDLSAAMRDPAKLAPPTDSGRAPRWRCRTTCPPTSSTATPHATMPSSA
jgi:prolyl oligopeptidase